MNTHNFFIDTHAHLYSDQFEADRAAMLERAVAAQVGRIYLPNVDSSSIEGMLTLEAQYPDMCYAMMGVHPCSIDQNYKKELAIAENWLAKRTFSGIGEIGMDKFWDTTHVKEQAEALQIQLRWAKELGRPAIIHSREAMDDILAMVEKEQDGRLRGIFHCFTGTLEQAQRVQAVGFLMGIGGVVTYKKSDLPPVLAAVPLEALVLETDAPYLPPTPHRGKRNESSYLTLVATQIAAIKAIPIEEVMSVTTANALRLFE